jgi:hydrogenase maturation factor
MSTECHDEVCITCSDQLLSLIVTGVDLDASVARGIVDGLATEVGIELIDEVLVGDVLLCHGGVALQRSAPLEVGA